MATTIGTFEVEPVTVEVVQPAPDAAEGVYIYNSRHAEEMAEHLIEWFRKPRNVEYLRIVGGQVQAIEDVIAQMRAAFDVDTAVGDQLDLLGKNVGELRDNRTDADYRAAVRARVLVNSSNGRQEELIEIVLALLPDADGNIHLSESYPASMRIEVLDDFTGATPATVARMLKQAKAAGVRLTFVPVDTGSTAIFSSPAGPDLTNGWGAEWARAIF